MYKREIESASERGRVRKREREREWERGPKEYQKIIIFQQNIPKMM